MASILITGGAGFIGSQTVEALLKKDMRVIVYDNLSSGKLSNLDLFNPNLEFQPGDILDYPALLKQVHRVDAVLHLAAIPSAHESMANPVRSMQVNTQGFLHVLQAIREVERPVRLVYASSDTIYGNKAVLPFDDAMPVMTEALLSPYALEKANNEYYADLYARLFGIKSLGLRYFNVYGKHQDPTSPYSGVIPKFIASYRRGEPICIWGDGLQARDFIYITDVVRANLLAIHSDCTGVLNIATGQGETLLNLVQCLENFGGRKAELQFLPERKGEVRDSYARIDHARAELTFEYATPLVEGIPLMMCC